MTKHDTARDGEGLASMPSDIKVLTVDLDMRLNLLQRRLANDHAEIAAELPKVLKTIVALLKSDNPKVAEAAVKLWLEVNTSAAQRDMEVNQFIREIGERMLDHQERMARAGGASAPDFITDALDKEKPS